MAVLAALIAPSLLQYTERSRAQKDVSSMDEVVNSVQLAMANSDCYDEAIKYSCDNNFITYTDSSGRYGQQELDGEYWAPDGSGKATTITFNPETDSFGNTIYKLENGIVNDMTYGNGSVAQDRVMEGAQIENNQCYLKNLTYLYNLVRQSIGNDVITTSATYKNSSFTIFITFSQKDGVKVADVRGMFNGTNLTPDSQSSSGSGTLTYDPDTGEAEVTITNPGKIDVEFTQSDLSGGGISYPDYKTNVYYTGVESNQIGDYSGATIVQNGQSSNTVSDGDVFVDTYYEYRYNYSFGDEGNGVVGWHHHPEQEGWGVKAIDTTLQSYGEIKSSIAGKPITALKNTFNNCKKMTASPTIPYGVTNMSGTFYGCEELRTAPAIPDTVTRVHCIFYKCYWLKTAPKLPDGVEDLYEAFFYCTRLVEVPELPQNTKSMCRTFSGCLSLVTAPEIPLGVTSLQETFAGCAKLSGLIKIHANPTEFNLAFKDTKNSILLSGSSTKLTELAATDGYTDMSPQDNVRVVNNTTHNDIVPEGGIYYVGVTSTTAGDYTGATATYTEGQNFPTPKKGDVYVYGDYEYRYNMAYQYYTHSTGRWGGDWCSFEDAIQIAYNGTNYMDDLGLTSGWGVRILDTSKVNVREILSSINGKPTTTMSHTFSYSALTTSPSIPSTVTCLYATYSCSALSKLPTTNHLNIKSLRSTFAQCDNLKSAKDMVIQDSVTSLFATFAGCENLQDAPNIPSQITMMSDLFDGCENLTGTIIIDASPTKGYLYECFAHTKKPIFLSGNSTKLSELAATDGFSDLSTKDNVRVKANVLTADIYMYESNKTVTFEFEEGMTWQDWHNSDYAKFVLVANGYGNLIVQNEGFLYYDFFAGQRQTFNDVIDSGHNYIADYGSPPL